MTPPPSPLSLPAPLPLTPEVAGRLSEMLGKIYLYCLEHPGERLGRADVTWEMDLRARGFLLRPSAGAEPEVLEGLSFTPHVDDSGNVVGSRFVFRRPGGDEDYFVRERVGFTALQNYLTGNEFERTFTPPLPEPIDPAEWDRWGHGLTEDIGKHYETVIYPRVVETLRKLGERHGDRLLDVMDLGGGAGRLSELICERVPDVARVRMLDRSAALVEKAMARAARFPGRLLPRRADVTAEGFSLDPGEAPDVVILCGVVAQQVMTHEEGVGLMQKCHEALAAGGFALVPSYSPALLSSREYVALGFVVHNRTLSLIEATSRGRTLRTNDFYVLEKPPSLCPASGSSETVAGQRGPD